MKNLIYLTLLSFLFVTCAKDGTKPSCPAHYTGANCDEQITPTNIIINSVTVTKFPPTDNGAGWDLTSGPDCYISILRDGVSIFNNRATFQENATGSFMIPVNLTLPSGSDFFYTVFLFDFDDFDQDDFMGGIQGALYFSTNGFPGSVDISAPNSAVSFTCNLSYTF